MAPPSFLFQPDERARSTSPLRPVSRTPLRKYRLSLEHFKESMDMFCNKNALNKFSMQVYIIRQIRKYYKIVGGDDLIMVPTAYEYFAFKIYQQTGHVLSSSSIENFFKKVRHKLKRMLTVAVFIYKANSEELEAYLNTWPLYPHLAFMRHGRKKRRRVRKPVAPPPPPPEIGIGPSGLPEDLEGIEDLLGLMDYSSVQGGNVSDSN